MSWLFSQALVVEYSAANCSDGEPSAPLSVMPTPHKFWRNDKTMEPCQLSRFGLTCAVLTADRGEALLTLWREAFPVRIFPSPDEATDLKASEVAYGQKCSGSFAKFDREKFVWKTHQFSLLGGLDEFSETWPRWGLMQDGECWALISPVLTTKDCESGLLPTVLATDWKGGTTAPRSDSGKLRFDQWRDFIKLNYGMTYPHPTHSELRMGWPEGWTDLKPLAMDKYREWLLQHSISCQEE